ncbi:MAG: YCF48-related protein [Bacteroidota bacterium]
MKYLTFFLVLIFACENQKEVFVEINKQNSGKEVSLRGLDVVDSSIAWASGVSGTVLRTIDKGETWEDVSINEADSIDFRDIEAFSATSAIVLSAGSPGLIYKTIDGGKNWQLVYQDYRENIFFDAMDFWDRDNGIAFGDAIEDKVVIIITDDGGDSWHQLTQDENPDALPNEGGFAASGTCITVYGDSMAWIALGTPESRILFSPDRGKTWIVQNSNLAQEAPGAGVFSLAFSSPGNGIAVGGNYEAPNDTTRVLSITEDGGSTWFSQSNTGLSGYKSAVEHIPESDYWLSAGPSGVDFSSNNGKSWSMVDTCGYHTVVMANGNSGWLTGANGKIGRIIINKH